MNNKLIEETDADRAREERIKDMQTYPSIKRKQRASAPITEAIAENDPVVLKKLDAINSATEEDESD